MSHTPMTSVLVLSALGLLSSAHAATYTVNTTLDSASAAVTSTGTDSFTTDSLRAAVAAANTNPGADTIVLPAGTFILSGAEGGALNITDPLTLRGVNAKLTVIDANQTDRVLSFANTASPSQVENLSVRNGRLVSASGPAQGGGIYSDRADLTLKGCQVIDNTAVGSNDTLGNTGGGQAAGGGVYVNVGSLTVEACAIVNNHAQGGEVSAGTQFGGPAFGGGIFRNGIQGFGTVSITNTTLSGNHAEGGANTTTDASGASGTGGGVYFSGTNATISNTTITANRATDKGTGSVGDGGGVSNSSGEIRFQSTIVAGNQASDRDPDIAGANLISQNHNLIGIAGSEGFFNGPQTSDLVGSDATPIDPGLADLADNGGATLTHALLPDSPARDAGSNPLELPYDQRGVGFPREVASGAPDIGALEAIAIFNDGFEGDAP